MAKSWKWITTVGKSRFRSVLNEALQPLPSRPPPTDSALPHTPLSLRSAWTAFSLRTLACASHSSATSPQIHLTDPTARPDLVGAPSVQSAFALPPARTRNRVLCFPNNPPPPLARGHRSLHTECVKSTCWTWYLLNRDYVCSVTIKWDCKFGQQKYF